MFAAEHSKRRSSEQQYCWWKGSYYLHMVGQRLSRLSIQKPCLCFSGRKNQGKNITTSKPEARRVVFFLTFFSRKLGTFFRMIATWKLRHLHKYPSASFGILISISPHSYALSPVFQNKGRTWSSKTSIHTQNKKVSCFFLSTQNFSRRHPKTEQAAGCYLGRPSRRRWELMWDLSGLIGPAHRWITNSSFVQWMAFGTLVGGCGSEGLMELVLRWGNMDGMESELDTDGLLVGKRYAMHFRIRHNVGRRSFGMCFFRFEQAKG